MQLINKTEEKEKNLAYGGHALIEGIMMRGKNGYAYTIKKPDGVFAKTKIDYVALGKRIKILGLPFIRGISGFIENMVIGIKVLNKSAALAFPEEETEKMSNVSLFFTFLIAILFAMLLFVGLPRLSPILFKLDANVNPFIYNIVSAISRFVIFFLYLILISLMKDTKRLFAYHGAEHKTIHTYEKNQELTVENVKKNSRLHPRCGTAFLFIVMLITIIVFPFFDVFFTRLEWYKNLLTLPFGKLIQNIIIILAHMAIGMPVVASVSYELLKLSGRFYKNPLVKILIAPGLFLQLFTTKEPDDDMIKAGIISLNMVLNREDALTPRSVNDII